MANSKKADHTKRGSEARPRGLARPASRLSPDSGSQRGPPAPRPRCAPLRGAVPRLPDHTQGRAERHPQDPASACPLAASDWLPSWQPEPIAAGPREPRPRPLEPPAPPLGAPSPEAPRSFAGSLASAHRFRWFPGPTLQAAVLRLPMLVSGGPAPSKHQREAGGPEARRTPGPSSSLSDLAKPRKWLISGSPADS
ncbi:predicted GPI-anchored protein 58 [Choloepus didactylus]|uniref:predicted GPI-anchored protein 58 n=1 Tax=Choloepus didactylus TaxID=27675 RepID=UPI00189F5739|nr:predicted GPI-anchored protein 58 [Choloepus didactylus]